MDTFKIYPIRVGSFETLELSSLTLMQNQGQKLYAPLIMYLIRNYETCVLVDTGGSDEAWSAANHSKIIRPEEENPITALSALGVEAADIKYVVNTHLHWDHCFNNDAFPNAKIFIQKKELAYARKPLPVHYKFYEAEMLGFTPKWKAAENQIVEVDGEYELVPGIRLIPLPGHTPGFQGVLVNTEKGRYMIAGDTVGLLSNFVNKAPEQRICSGIYCDLSDSYASLEKIAELSDYVLPGHDPAVFSQRVYPAE